MNYLLDILLLPALIVFKVYYKRNTLVKEDFDAWYQRHKLSQKCKSKASAFLNLMRRFPEYRTVFYLRLPYPLRNSLRLIMPQRSIMFAINELSEGVLVEHGCLQLFVQRKSVKTSCFIRIVRSVSIMEKSQQ